MRRSTCITIVVALVATAAARPAGTAGQATPAPITDGEGSLASMLALLPAEPLGGGQITYADIAGQLAAVNVPAEPTTDDERGRWIAATEGLMFPSDAPRMGTEAWREELGYDLFDVDQAVEHAAPPYVVTILRGRFDETALPQTWDRAGYQPVEINGTTYYSIGEDFELDFSSDRGRLALAHLNNVALLDGGLLVASSARHGVEGVIRARAGAEPSMADDVSIAPLLRSVPPDLVSAVIVPGASLMGGFDPINVFDQSGTPGVPEIPDIEAIATQVAATEAELRRMPPIVAALIGATAGGPLRSPGGGTPVASAADLPTARLVAAVTTISPAAAETAAAVITDRLATHPLPPYAPVPVEGDYADLFPERTVAAVPGEPVALVELVPAPGVPRSILTNLLFSRTLTFLAWSL